MGGREARLTLGTGPVPYLHALNPKPTRDVEGPRETAGSRVADQVAAEPQREALRVALAGHVPVQPLARRHRQRDGRDLPWRASAPQIPYILHPIACRGVQALLRYHIPYILPWRASAPQMRRAARSGRSPD